MRSACDVPGEVCIATTQPTTAAITVATIVAARPLRIALWKIAAGTKTNSGETSINDSSKA